MIWLKFTTVNNDATIFVRANLDGDKVIWVGINGSSKLYFTKY